MPSQANLHALLDSKNSKLAQLQQAYNAQGAALEDAKVRTQFGACIFSLLLKLQQSQLQLCHNLYSIGDAMTEPAAIVPGLSVTVGKR